MSESILVHDEDKPNLFKWFNPQNIGHIAAFRYLCKTGQFPEGFLPAWIKQPTIADIFVLTFKMANAWMDHRERKRRDKHE